MNADRRLDGLCCRIEVDDAGVAERVVAEAFEAGALGVEERASASGVVLIAYLGAEGSGPLRAALRTSLAERVRVGADQRIPAQDWSETWKSGLEAIEISERLVVRPSCVAHPERPDQRVLVIDPKQAFGTGGHASTRLILEWVDILYTSAEGTADCRRIVDVGTGTGVLAMAALALGAEEAVAFDLDAVAVAEARSLAQSNGLADRLRLFAGPIQALGAGTERTRGFDLALVNLLRSEVLPIAGEIARRLRDGGRLVLSGLLEADRGEVLMAFEALGFVRVAEREQLDAAGDHWISPLLERRGCAGAPAN